MNEQDLKRFKDNHTYEEAALDLVEELHDNYGESFLSLHLYGCDDLHTVELMEQIKKEMDDKFIVSVCSTNEIIEEKLMIDDLFPNLYLMMDYDDIIRTLVEKEWLDEFVLMKPKKHNDWYRSRERTIYTKGGKWDKCPPHIQRFFNQVKDANSKKA